jgi:hypothetical protein
VSRKEVGLLDISSRWWFSIPRISTNNPMFGSFLEFTGVYAIPYV